MAGSLAGSFFYRPETTTELIGEHAKAQLHTREPVLYLHVDEDEDPEGENSGDEHTYQIVPAKVIKDHRVVTQTSLNQFTDHVAREDYYVCASVEKLPHGWIRVTVQSPLPPGEYVLLAQPVRDDEFATTVYPFAIDENASESEEAIRGEPTEQPGQH